MIVVDDGSSDATARLACEAGARVIPCEGSGVSDARNTGARHARGELVLFTDSDVILPPVAVDLILERIVKQGYDAVTGRLSRVHRHPGFASRYKNLWMAFTYEALPDEVALFYTSVSAIRRSVFLKLRGFDPAYRAPSVEDTAFGQMLRDGGYRVRAEKQLAVEHLKNYTAREVLALDMERSRALTRLYAGRVRSFIRHGNTSSVPTSFMLSVPMPLLGLALLVAGAALGAHTIVSAGLALFVLFLGLNGSFLSYLLRHGGLRLFFWSHLFLIADAVAVCAGVAAGLAGFEGRR
jgi:glycosyltransferase involved in cell wall biosynthesis